MLKGHQKQLIFRGIIRPRRQQQEGEGGQHCPVHAAGPSLARPSVQFGLKNRTVYVQPTWCALHLTDDFSLMDVASVTMFWACFSNGMSIILPWKVKAPCNTENTNFLKEGLEIIGFLLAHPCTTRTFLDSTWITLTFLPNFWESQSKLQGKDFLEELKKKKPHTAF